MACAQAVLDGVPAAFQFIRFTATQKRAKGLSVQQFRALGYLYKRPGDSLSMLAEYLGVSLATSSRLIDALVRKNLVHRATDPTSRRRVHLSPTPRGKQILTEVVRWTQQQLAGRLQNLPAPSRRRVIAAMSDLHNVLNLS